MAALTAARLTKSRGGLRLQKYPVAASTTIYAGSMVMINSAGYAVPAAAAANNKGTVGVAVATVDNSSGSAGDLDVSAQEGEFLFEGDSLDQANLGDIMFSMDDQTVGDDATATGDEPRCGRLTEFVSATSGWLRIGLDMLA